MCKALFYKASRFYVVVTFSLLLTCANQWHIQKVCHTKTLEFNNKKPMTLASVKLYD